MESSPSFLCSKEYQDLESFADFTSKLAEFELAGKPNFLPFGVSPDFMDARTNVLWASAPGTIFARYNLLC